METKQPTIIVRPATPEDAPIIAAALTMALGEETMRMYCGENYQDVLEELARMEHTQYSYRNALVADVDGTPAGAIVGYDGARLYELRRPTLQYIEERTGQSFEGVEDETHPGEYYSNTADWALADVCSLPCATKPLPKGTNGRGCWWTLRILRRNTSIRRWASNAWRQEISSGIGCGTCRPGTGRLHQAEIYIINRCICMPGFLAFLLHGRKMRNIFIVK